MHEIKALFSDLYFVEFGDGIESRAVLDGRDVGDERIMNMLGHGGAGIDQLISVAERLAGRIPSEPAKDSAHERICIAAKLLSDAFEDMAESSRWAAEAILNMTIVYSKVHGAQDD